MGRLQSAPCAAGVPGSATRGAVRAGERRRASGRGLILVFVLAPVVLAAAGRATAQACVEVAIDWPLKPSAIGRGDSFRLLFITSGTTVPGSREDIAFYNRRVRAFAEIGHLSMRAYTDKFRVLGSTAAVDARDNTGTTGTGVPDLLDQRPQGRRQQRRLLRRQLGQLYRERRRRQSDLRPAERARLDRQHVRRPRVHRRLQRQQGSGQAFHRHRTPLLRKCPEFRRPQLRERQRQAALRALRCVLYPQPGEALLVAGHGGRGARARGRSR